MGEVIRIFKDQEEFVSPDLSVIQGLNTVESLLGLNEKADEIAERFWRTPNTYDIFQKPDEIVTIRYNIIKLTRALLSHPDLEVDQAKSITKKPMDIVSKAAKVAVSKSYYKRQNNIAEAPSIAKVWNTPESRYKIQQHLLELGDPIMYLTDQIEKRRGKTADTQARIGHETLTIFLMGTGESRFRRAVGAVALESI